MGAIGSRSPIVADRSHVLRGNASRDAPRHHCARRKPWVGSWTQSVRGGVPTQSVGTIDSSHRSSATQLMEIPSPQTPASPTPTSVTESAPKLSTVSLPTTLAWSRQSVLPSTSLNTSLSVDW